MTSILQLIEQYDKQQHHTIGLLESKVKELTAENEKLKQIHSIKAEGLIKLLLGEILWPVGLEFDGRNFLKDLKNLVLITARKRLNGDKSRDEDGRSIAWTPDDAYCHRWLDKETGWINTTNSPRQMSLDETKEHIRQRSLWIDALLVEHNRIL